MTNHAYPHLAFLVALAFWAGGLSDAEARNRNKGRGSQIIGGANNTIDPGGDRSVIVGGNRNRINRQGKQAAIGGGQFNVVNGTASWAGGTRARALHGGTLVWSGAQSGFFDSTGANQFLIRAAGGVGINTNVTGGNALAVQGRAQITGDLEVTGNIIGNITSAFATVGNISSSDAFTIQTGGSGGFVVGVQTNDPEFNLLSRNIVAGYQSNSVSPGVVGATIGGGGALDGPTNQPNRVTGIFGTVSGGLNNEAGPFALVAGGEGNKAVGEYSSVLGGYYNEAKGTYSTVAGGGGNVAVGEYSFAAGRQARAEHAGAFVWADDQEAFFRSTGPNQFLIRATGGVGINTNNPGTNALAVAGGALVDGPLQIATIQVLTGSGDPTNDAPDGSLYLNTSGSRTNTLWIRARGEWYRLEAAPN